MSGQIGSMFSFRTGDDPYAEGSMSKGANTGMAIGSMFGPIGAAAGLFIGAGVGMLAGNDDRKKARRKVTKLSYEFGKEVLDYTNKSREQIGKTFRSKRASTVAQMAGSGIVAEGPTFRSAEGSLIRERDAALTTLDAELDEFATGPNMEWVRNDIDYMMNVSGFGEGRTGQTAFSDSEGNQYGSIGAPGEGRVTAAQGRDAEPGAYAGVSRSKYMEKVKPDVGLYLRSLYGSDEDKATYAADMKGKILEANKWRDQKMQLIKVNKWRQAQFERGSAN